jgi:hypothetical protein
VGGWWYLSEDDEEDTRHRSAMLEVIKDRA